MYIQTVGTFFNIRCQLRDTIAYLAVKMCVVGAH